LLHVLFTAVGVSLGLVFACANPSFTSSQLDYSQLDQYSSDVYTEVVKNINDESYRAKISAGMNVSPGKYHEVIIGNLIDGEYTLGGFVFTKVLSQVKHARDLTANLKQFAKTYPKMKDLFKKYQLQDTPNVKADDIRLYFRFGADFFANGGFAGDSKIMMRKYSELEVIRVIRAGIFITQLPQIGDRVGGASFALIGPRLGINGSGAPAAAATNIAGKHFSATKYNAQNRNENGCNMYKNPSVPLPEDCVSPAEDSTLWGEGCRDNPGGNPICGESNCGRKIKITVNRGGKSLTKSGTICGYCPKRHKENQQYQSCANGDNLDMSEKLYSDLGYSGSNQRQSGSNLGDTMTVQWD